ncbi:MAG: hypothetical protein AAF830_07805 [Pseudomonadota bacterium]
MNEPQPGAPTPKPWYRTWRGPALGGALVILLLVMIPSKEKKPLTDEEFGEGLARRFGEACREFREEEPNEYAIRNGVETCDCVERRTKESVAELRRTFDVYEWYVQTKEACALSETLFARDLSSEDRDKERSEAFEAAIDKHLPGLREDLEKEGVDVATVVQARRRQRAPSLPRTVPTPTEPEISKSGQFVIHDYGPAPDDFVPPIPKELPKTSLHLLMEKTSKGALKAMEVQPFGPWSLTREYRVGSENQALLNEDLSAISREKPKVLVCKYVSARKGTTNVSRHWYQDVPSRADAKRLRKRLADHPVLVINGSRDTCAPTYTPS